MNDLLPCRCGSIDIEVVGADRMPGAGCYARCKDCGNCERGSHQSAELAIEAWNECAMKHYTTRGM